MNTVPQRYRPAVAAVELLELTLPDSSSETKHTISTPLRRGEGEVREEGNSGDEEDEQTGTEN